LPAYSHRIFAYCAEGSLKIKNTAGCYYTGSSQSYWAYQADEDLMKGANLIEHEKMQVGFLNNGERLETHVIADKGTFGICRGNRPAAGKAWFGIL